MKRVLLALIAAGLIAGCSQTVETDQARLCRMALPALVGVGATIEIAAQRPDTDGRGLAIVFTAAALGEPSETHLAACRFREPGRPRASRDLVGLTFDGEALGEARLFALVRYWLGDARGPRSRPRPAR